MMLALRQRKCFSRFLLTIIYVLFLTFVTGVSNSRADDRLNSFRLYTGRLFTNHWEDFFQHQNDLNFIDSYFAAATLSHQIHKLGDKVSLEIEGQVVKHFNYQNHWEINTLVTARWGPFWWDAILDTSAAFGLGPSWATDKPEVENENDGDTSQFLIYWMMELTFSLPAYPHTALITRIHHRSNGFDLVADDGGSNAFALGLAYQF